MKSDSEDGSLGEITSSSLNSEFNVIIIQTNDECEEADGASYAFATLDRTKDGVEWSGDQILEKLIPDLPKVKTPEVTKPDVRTKRNSFRRHPVERKFSRRPSPKNSYIATTRRSKPPQKRFRPERSGNPSFDDIDPWVCKPWENKTFFPQGNNPIPSSATPQISTVPCNNFTAPNCNTYDKSIATTTAPKVAFINNHMVELNRPPPQINRIPVGSHSLFSLPNRFSQPPDRGICVPGPVPINNPSHNAGLLGEAPASRHPVKHGLLGDSPFSNMPYNRNLVMGPNSVSQGNASTLLPIDEENIGNKNNFAKNNSIIDSYDDGYGRVPRSNFNQYKDYHETSEQELHNSYDYQSNNVGFRNNSFRDTSEKNYSRFQNSDNPVNYFNDQYIDHYNHLDHNHPIDNSTFEGSGEFSKKNYRRFEKPPVATSHFESSYKEVSDDNRCENIYNDSQISGISRTSPVTNNWNHNSDSLNHVNNSAVVYDQEGFQNERYPHSTTRSGFNAISRSNIRRNIHTKNFLGKKRQWTRNKFTNNYFRVKSNRGQQRFRRWRTPQK